MKYYLLSLLLFCIASTTVSGQNKSIVDDLNASKPGQGKIAIYQDESIDGLIGTNTYTSSANPVTEKKEPGNKEVGSVSEKTPNKQPSRFIQTKGYKIQVFSGNDQRKSKAEAQSRKQQIESSFSDMEVVIIYNSPVWRVRAGNFKSYEEAFQTMKELKNAFPSFGREMQIVESVIKLPVY